MLIIHTYYYILILYISTNLSNSHSSPNSGLGAFCYEFCKYVQEYLDNRGAYEKEYHKRSLEEAANNLIKNGLVDTENASNGTGLRNRNLHVKLCFLAMQLVALIRHNMVA